MLSSRLSLSVVGAALSLLLGGTAGAQASGECSGPPVKKVPGRQLNGRELNGSELNGRQLNGTFLNGRQLNGLALNGLEVNGRQLNGRQLNGVELSGMTLSGAKLSGGLSGSELTARLPDGGSVSGCDMAGVVLQGVVVGELGWRSEEVPLTIAAVGQDSDPDNTDVWFYDVTYPTKDGPEPLCGTYPDGGDANAVALSGTWNYGEGWGGGSHSDDGKEFTLACDGAGLYKCAIDIGYKPWSTVDGTSMEPYHEACTRTLRADYCGDGVPHTIDGTVIDLYDSVGVQLDTDPTWDFEAEWTPDGAACVDHLRIGNRSDIRCDGRELPHNDCGDPAHFESGTLIMDRHNPTTSTSTGSGGSSGGGGDNGGRGSGGGDNGGGGGWGWGY